MVKLTSVVHRHKDDGLTHCNASADDRGSIIGLGGYIAESQPEQ